jgi:aminoethylphosphonate catabolism LysR family transcriptional regulator
MRYSQLRAFHHVALHGGFSRAADYLNQTQPALSDQVRRLEQENDVLLFHRERKQIRLTEQGKALFMLTRRFFDAEASIRDYLAQSGTALGRKIRIVVDSALHVTDTLGRFRAAYPEVFIQLHTGNSEEVLRMLRDYEAEIGVVGSLDPEPDLITVDLGSAPIRAVAARGFLPSRVTELHLNDLSRWPLIFREKGSRTRLALEQAAEAQGVELAPVMEVDGREAMREIVSSGAGIGFVSEAEFGTDPRLVQVPLTGVELRMTETLVYLAIRREVPVISAFMKVLRETTNHGDR